jgi:hypothetical protein
MFHHERAVLGERGLGKRRKQEAERGEEGHGRNLEIFYILKTMGRVASLSVLFLTVFACAEGFFFGGEFALTLNTLRTSTGYRETTSYGSQSGASVGIPLLYKFESGLALGTGVQYATKNYSFGRTGEKGSFDSKMLRSVWTNDFVEAPLFARYSFGKRRVSGFVDAGGFVGWWMGSHREGVAMGMSLDTYNETIPFYSYDEDVSFDSRRDNRFEAGLLAGGGIAVQLGPYGLFATVRWTYGLTDLQKNYQQNLVARYNNTVFLQTGILFSAGSLFPGDAP